ncbi:MAG: RNA 2',3'-cyclic phosphodiesterase [bacterium]|nr:MAG: RNA 2',3'-cyclic phosphodiesterase [bacterium]
MWGLDRERVALDSTLTLFERITVMRLFFAVVTADSVKRIVERQIETFPVQNPPWRWIPPENYHMTLKFLGDVEEDRLRELGEAALSVAPRIPPFRLAYGGFGVFPSLSRPRVIFYELKEGHEELATLAGALEGALEQIGFPRERRPFRAHLTLARIKRPLPPQVRNLLTTVPPLPGTPAQQVDSFVLMRSHLRRTGAVYEEIEQFDCTG